MHSCTTITVCSAVCSGQVDRVLWRPSTCELLQRGSIWSPRSSTANATHLQRIRQSGVHGNVTLSHHAGSIPGCAPSAVCAGVLRQSCWSAWCQLLLSHCCPGMQKAMQLNFRLADGLGQVWLMTRTHVVCATGKVQFTKHASVRHTYTACCPSS